MNLYDINSDLQNELHHFWIYSPQEYMMYAKEENGLLTGFAVDREAFGAVFVENENPMVYIPLLERPYSPVQPISLRPTATIPLPVRYFLTTAPSRSVGQEWFIQDTDRQKDNLIQLLAFCEAHDIEIR